MLLRLSDEIDTLNDANCVTYHMIVSGLYSYEAVFRLTSCYSRLLSVLDVLM